MSTLYSCVHHEMLGPLKSNEEAVTRLLAALKDPRLISLAKISLLSTKKVILHANDLLDQKLIQNGRFSPSYSPDSVSRAIVEIVKIISMTINERDVKIIIDLAKVQSNFPILSFDTRRLQ